MPGLNVTGQSKTRDYLVGRGNVMLAKLNQYDVPGEYREVGNAKTLRISAESETLEHFSSKNVARTKDAEVALETSANIEIVVDEINIQNLATFFVGDEGTHSNAVPASTALSDGQCVFPNALLDPFRVAYGRWYELWSYLVSSGPDVYAHGLGPQISLAGAVLRPDSMSDRIYRIDAESDVTIVIDDGGGADTYTGGTDFDVDIELGMVFIPQGGALAAAIAGATVERADNASEFIHFDAASAATKITVDIASQGADPGAPVDEMRALTAASQSFAMKYVMLNANDNGHKTEVQVHKIKLVPNGDFDLLTEDAFAELTLTGSAEQNLSADADSGFVTMRTRRV